jgi:hypothetical protein
MGKGNDDGNPVVILNQDKSVARIQEFIEFDYISKENFTEFLYRQEKGVNSIVQSFITPQ